MSKRNPNAAALAHPMFRQRTKEDARRVAEYDRWLADLAECYAPPQADQWQEPLRQMEG